jgi:hypothetical protein
MHVISLRRLAEAETEDLIAALWYTAEEYGVPSPRLSVRQVGEALDLHIEFLSEKDGALMRRVVPRLAIEPSLPELALSTHTSTGDPGGDSDPHGVDPALRDRVVEQIPIVTDALEAVVANPSDDKLDKLREATDKLMRALSRVLIEVERQRNAPMS